MQFLKKIFQGRDREMSPLGAICIVALLSIAMYAYTELVVFLNKPICTQTSEFIHLPKAFYGTFSGEFFRSPSISIVNTRYQRDPKYPPSRLLYTTTYTEDDTIVIDIQGYFTYDCNTEIPESNEPRYAVTTVRIPLETTETLDTVIMRLSGEENRYRITRGDEHYLLEPVEISNIFIFDQKIHNIGLKLHFNTFIEVLTQFCTQYGTHSCMGYAHQAANDRKYRTPIRP